MLPHTNWLDGRTCWPSSCSGERMSINQQCNIQRNSIKAEKLYLHNRTHAYALC